MTNFATLSDEYVSVAHAASIYFRGLGYTISKEKHKLGFPYVPALIAKRSSTTLIIEVGPLLSEDRYNEWVSYCKSVGEDNRVVLATREKDIPRSDITKLTVNGIGFYAKNGDFHEILAPKDIGIHVAMPSISDIPKKLRRILGPTYEKVNRNEPIEAFEEACKALEVIARPYLWGRISSASNPAILQDGNRNVSLTKDRIDKMTLGQLGLHFGYIQQMNHADSILSQTIPAINKDRVKVAHRKQQHSGALRKKAGRNIWSIIMALKSLP